MAENTQVATKGRADRAILWAIVAPAVLIAAVVLLVGLPLGAVWIMNMSGCCLTGGSERVITFWASMIAGFLTLFGMLVTGVFVLTAFKNKAEAQSEARQVAHEVSKAAAHQAAQTFLKERKGELFQELHEAADEVAQQAAKIKDLRNKATELEKNVSALTEATSKAQGAIDAAWEVTSNAANAAQGAIGEAQEAIGEAREATSNAASTAQEAIGEAREATSNAASAAQEAIGEAREATSDAASAAQEAIGRARQDAEDAARAVREFSDRATGGTPQPEGDSEQPGE